ncbi:hypothetical protein A9Q81_03135 [Gammaproteobacteria bacterium 42_54_T18]|nr:hypothetical protein A9Q81_03135 [Gammaproteobacteria bacterium 42_54_T18]
MNKVQGIRWIAVGSMVLAMAVVLGAFGAHGLKDVLSESRMAVYQTAVQYHFYHGFGLMLVGLVMSSLPDVGLRWVPRLLLLGLVLFSGSLYALILLNLGWLGVVTPIGGLSFIAGWVLLAVVLWKQSKN